MICVKYLHISLLLSFWSIRFVFSLLLLSHSTIDRSIDVHINVQINFCPRLTMSNYHYHTVNVSFFYYYYYFIFASLLISFYVSDKLHLCACILCCSAHTKRIYRLIVLKRVNIPQNGNNLNVICYYRVAIKWLTNWQWLIFLLLFLSCFGFF